MAPASNGPGRRRQRECRAGSTTTGETLSSTARWNDVPRGTMDEVSSHVRLDLPLTARPPERLLHPVFEPHHGRASGADSGEKHEPAGDTDTAVVASLELRTSCLLWANRRR